MYYNPERREKTSGIDHSDLPIWNTLLKFVRIYTINGAKHLGIEARKGADFLVFDDDTLTAEPEGFGNSLPRNAYLCGRKVK